ncbi:uncharacterized protein LOC113502283 [Trichoplusia ni]|uniref:Regulatory protein zeste n=1 Tax=Trichoplusia ni TaxID=7111 RepID=A0A7E5WHG3_TRINI|nr:uncharacterized protein LOC113502283 [Trichoplusia ni]
MDSTPSKNKAMSKDEIHCLVELVEANKIIVSKETNASTNRLKDEAWVSLTAAFNARNGTIPRQKEQLKSKWDNLKKAARKRAQQIRMNHLKTGGGKPDYIPPDETLSKVESLLGSTCNGFVVPFGGDGVGDVGDNIVVQVFNEIGESPSAGIITNEKINDDDLVFTPTTSGGLKRKAEERKFLFGMHNMSNSLKTKEKKRKENDDSRQQLNLAAKYYYEKKAEKLELEIKLLRIELANKENNCNCNLNK